MASPLPLYPPPRQQSPMEGIESPTDHDVKSGRGVSTNSHPGNERFRSLVNCNKELYVTSTKRQKMAISRSIVEAVRSLDPPGRFLERNPETGLWSDIGDKKAIEKTSQALRDGAAVLRKQLATELGDPDFLSDVFDADAVPPEDLSGNKQTKAKKGKGKAPAKGHKRAKSNPSVGTATKTKALVKKAASGEIPTSPKQRSHLNLPLIPRPPQSPMSPGSGSDRASPAGEARSGHHRNNSGGSAPPAIFGEADKTRYAQHDPASTSPQYPYGLPPRSASFDYHDLEHGRQHEQACRPSVAPPPPQSPSAFHRHHSMPPPAPSPRGYLSPHPTSPRGQYASPRPGQPLPPGRHHMSPSGYHQGPPSPRIPWSPRQFSHPSPESSFSSSQPYLNQDTSPQRTSEYRPNLAPRAHYSNSSQHGNQPPNLSVPMLWGERGSQGHGHSPPSPMWRSRPPSTNAYYSPRSSHGQGYEAPHHAYSGQPVHPEFSPPPPPPPPRPRGEQTSPHSDHQHRYRAQHRIMSPTMYRQAPESQEQTLYPDMMQSREHHYAKSAGTPDAIMSSRGQHVEELREHRDNTVGVDVKPPMQARETIAHASPSPTTIKQAGAFDSPSAVMDVARAETPLAAVGVADTDLPMDIELCGLTRPETLLDDRAMQMQSPTIQRRKSQDSEEHPWDEANPAVEYISVSPLPFDHEDPQTLLEIPDSIFHIPICPCGPQDSDSQ